MEKLTQKEAAQRLEVSPRTLRRHTEAGSVTRLDDGSYPWPEVFDDWRKNVVPQEDLKQIDAASRLGIDVRWVRKLTRQGVLSRNADGSYPYPKVQAEHDAFIRQSDERRDDGGDAELNLRMEQARLAKEKADAQEMENAIRRGELIAIDDVESLVRRSLEKVSVVTKEIPSRYAPGLAREAGIPLVRAKQIMGEISESIRRELRDLAA